MPNKITQVDDSVLLRKVFEHIQANKVIICRSCKYAVAPNQVYAHLYGSIHPDITADQRRAIRTQVGLLQCLAHKPEDVILPDSSDPPIRFLGPYNTGGFKCKMLPADGIGECGYVVGTKTGIQAHLRNIHDWTNPNGRGQRSEAHKAYEEELWETGICYQNFHRVGAWMRLFQVTPYPIRPVEQPIEEASEESVSAMKLAIRDTREQFQANWKKSNELSKKEVITISTDRLQANAWLPRTGWEEHLSQFDARKLLGFVKLPIKSEEPILFSICAAIEDVIWDASEATKNASHNTKVLLESQEIGGAAKAFYTGHKAATIVRYATYWKQIFCYIWRTHKLISVTKLKTKDPANSEIDENSLQQHRPAYQLLDTQSADLQAIEKHATSFISANKAQANDESDTVINVSLERSILRFWIGLLHHEVGDDDYRSPLVSALAVLGIRSDGGWARPQQYTQILSGMITIARMLVCLKATNTRNEAICDHTKVAGVSKADADERVRDVRSWVQDMCNQFMRLVTFDGQPTPMNWMLELRSYGLKIRFNTNDKGRVDWIGETLLYEDTEYDMPTLRSFIHGLLEQTRQQLFFQCLLLSEDSDEDKAESSLEAKSQLPSIPWSKIKDSQVDHRAEHNFLKNNDLEIDGKEYLFDFIMKSGKLQGEFLDMRYMTKGPQSNLESEPTPRFRWNTGRLLRYIKAVHRFKELLLALVLFTGGQPPRGTEFLSVKHTNSKESDRGVFIDKNNVVLVTRYHKSFSKSGQMKIIHRFLPREVGELVVYYLWLVLPFWQTVQVMHGKLNVKQTESLYLWHPKDDQQEQEAQRRREISRQKRKREVTRLDDDSGYSISSSDSLTLSHTFSSSNPSTSSLVETDPYDSIMDEIDFRFTEKYDSNTFRHIINKVTRVGLQASINPSQLRHQLISIFRKYLPGQSKLHRVLDNGDNDEEEDEFADLQAGHVTKTARAVYGRDTTEHELSSSYRINGFYEVSRWWHTFLVFSSVTTIQATSQDDSTTPHISKVLCTFEGQEAMRARWRKQRRTDLLWELRSMLKNNDAQFRDSQKEVLDAIMHQKSPILSIMRTGAGKSLLFMLPAFCSDGISIIVVPMVAIRQDMLRRCEEAGIDCVEWKSISPQDSASIVLVTPESAVTKTFWTFLNRQRSLGRLDRIVMDECHTILESADAINPWRTSIKLLKQLACTETQLLYLTATLPPQRMSQFEQLIGTRNSSIPLLTFRDRTTRKNIAYRDIFYDITQEDRAVYNLVQQKLRVYRTGTIVVICDTVARAERLALVLDCLCYHGKIGSPQQKAEILRKLREEIERVLCGTNAFGLGIDSPSIRSIIHVGKQRKIENNAQEGGRGGRDGKRSEAIIMHGVHHDVQDKPQIDRFYKDCKGWMDEYLFEFVSTTNCKRLVLDRYLDGFTERIGCEADEEACSNCHRTWQEDEIIGDWPEVNLEEDLHVGREDTDFSDYERILPIIGQQDTHMTGTKVKEIEEIEEIEEEFIMIAKDPPSGQVASITRSSMAVLSTPERPTTISRVCTEQSGLGFITARQLSNDRTTPTRAVYVGPNFKPVRASSSRSTQQRPVSHDMGPPRIRSRLPPTKRPQFRHLTPLNSSRLPLPSIQQATEERTFEEESRARRRHARQVREGHSPSHFTQETLEDKLVLWGKDCAICRVRGISNYDGHELDYCPDPARKEVVSKRDMLEGRTTFQAWSGCSRCRIPQSICARWRAREVWGFECSGLACQYEHVLGSACAAILILEETKEAAQDWMMDEMTGDGTLQGSVEVAEMERKLGKWLGMKVKVGRMEANHLCELFVVIG